MPGSGGGSPRALSRPPSCFIWGFSGIPLVSAPDLFGVFCIALKGRDFELKLSMGSHGELHPNIFRIAT